VLVIGDTDLFAVSRCLRPIQNRLGIDVQPVIASRAEWKRPSRGSFLRQLGDGPLVSIPLTSVTVDA
jgi:hypothetical protein